MKHERKRIEAAAPALTHSRGASAGCRQWSASSPSYLCDKILQIIGLTDQSDRRNDNNSDDDDVNDIASWRKQKELETERSRRNWNLIQLNAYCAAIPQMDSTQFLLLCDQVAADPAQLTPVSQSVRSAQ